MHGWSATARRARNGFTKPTPKELRCCGSTSINCGGRRWLRSRRPRKRRKKMTEPVAARANDVRKTLSVDVSVERAFAVFTENMEAWWPATHHVAKQPFAAIVVEPRTGGRWFEIAADGTECDWGRVLAW